MILFIKNEATLLKIREIYNNTTLQNKKRIATNIKSQKLFFWFLIMNEYDLSCHLQWPGEVLFEGSAGHQILSERVAWLQFELSRSVLAGFDALAPLTLEALLDGYEATQACTSSQCQSYQGASLNNLSGIPSIWQEQSICKFMVFQ